MAPAPRFMTLDNRAFPAFAAAFVAHAGRPSALGVVLILGAALMG